ncbi:hypothetical protein [uncultured Clostridium sp.]|uniref:hypothetical protein n=1 Tax=uncultured Clostridium sp. TaxID=59620 RepID=UPI00261E7140|nr:hypothetical protein [uncultured Clostridium sp.]
MRKKPKIKYTTMCIYIDEHVYEKDHDVEKIFNYLQCLFYALACKKRFFSKEKDYDNYSLYGATHMYMRLINKNQFLPEDDPKYMPKVKSVLNYIKTILYPLKVNYQQENFNYIFNEEYVGTETIDSIETGLRGNIDAGTRGLLQAEVLCYLKDIPKIIKIFLKQTPYAQDSGMMHKLYMSILITLLRMITLSNHNYNRLIKDQELKLNAEDLAEDLLREEKVNAPVAWHLDNMEDYIYVLCNKIIKLIVRDIRSLIQSYEPSEEIIKDILMSPLSEYNENNN